MGGKFADAAITDIIEALEQLETVTGLGKPSQYPDLKALILSRHLFIAPYRVIHNIVQILRILHQQTERPED